MAPGVKDGLGDAATVELKVGAEHLVGGFVLGMSQSLFASYIIGRECWIQNQAIGKEQEVTSMTC